MRFDRLFRTLGPVIAMAMAAGCDGAKFHMNGKEGMPLSELDLSGNAPHSINLAGPDIVRITQGTDFTIALEGDDEAKERMRFLLEDETLLILREGENWSGGNPATVTVTMPAPRHLVLAGSGAIHSDALAAKAEVTIAGSGKVETPSIQIESLDVNVMGSGSYRAGGTADRLDLSIAGSGDADMARLKIGKAEISIAGSGDTNFASDGNVDARIMGSGNITVRGSARCKVKSFGSGTLTCERGETVENEEA
jgi:hypothetical protein